MAVSLNDALAMVPLWKGQPVETHELSGGITNRSYRVQCNGTAYVLRLACGHTSRLGISRRSEHAATLAAARAGLAPAICFAEAQRGVLISDHVAGHHWGNKQISDGDNISRLAAALRRIHALKVELPRFDPLQLALQYRQQLHDLGNHPADDRLLARVLDLHRRVPQCRQLAVCHNDVVRSNFIDDGQRLWFIDWECAGLNDPYYDLAIVSHNNRLSPPAERQLLRAYCAEAADPDISRLAWMKLLHDVYHVYWYALQLALASPLAQMAYRQGHQHHATRLAAELDTMQA